MTVAAEKQEFSFQAEIKQLLHLLSHSLYQSREITIRELVSNASDALDKQRYLALVNGSKGDDRPLEIFIEPRKDQNELVIRDNGVGMTHDELVKNLGTIARSGSLEFLKTMADQTKGDVSLIGKFGVGFYSAFMLADRVTVRTKSDSDEQGWEWESEGTGTFQISPVDSKERGTEVVLHLKDDAREFSEAFRVQHVVRTYSSFIPYPIKIEGEVVNDQKPIWVEPKSQVTPEQYEQFYQHLTHHIGEKPMWHVHMAVDSPMQFRAIVYCPQTNIEKFGMHRQEHGLSLCARRVLVQRECRELVPDYLRFLYGLVDSEDLPLNVSRETLQDNSVIRKIRDSLVKGVLDRLERMAKDEPEAYLTFYREFGGYLKEGVVTDHSRKERIASLLRFASSKGDDPTALVSLDEYLARAPVEQKQIYYLCGPDLATISKSPSLEVLRRRGLEVLFLPEPIDEFVVMELRKYLDKPFKSADAADLDLPGAEPEKSETTEQASESSGFKRVLELVREALGNRVKEVRASKRLAESPACLVDVEGGMSSRMERLLRMADKPAPATLRILELNPASQLIERLALLASNNQHDDFIKLCGLQLWSDALLLEGVVNDPRDVVSRVESLLLEAATKRSPLVI